MPKYKNISIAFLSTFIVFFIAIFAYQYGKNSTNPISVISPQPTTIPISPSEGLAKDWQTYKNDKYGFEFQYPAKYQHIPDRSTVSQDLYFMNQSKADSFMVSYLRYSKTLSDFKVNYLAKKISDIAYYDLGNPLYLASPSDQSYFDQGAIYQKNGYIFVIYSQVLSQETISSIISTIKFSSPTPTIKAVIETPKLLSTSDWVDQVLGNISFKLPANIKLHSDGQSLVRVEDGFTSYISLIVTDYDGGSRRQWWQKYVQADDKSISTYARFVETKVGQNTVLSVFADGGWWQGSCFGGDLISSGKKIVFVKGCHQYSSDTKLLTRDPKLDTIASTIRFL